MLPGTTQQRQFAAWRGGAMAAAAAAEVADLHTATTTTGDDAGEIDVEILEPGGSGSGSRSYGDHLNLDYAPGDLRRRRRAAAPNWFSAGEGVFPLGPWLRRADHAELGRSYVAAAAKAVLA